jgi:WD40 repeat protein
MLVLLSRFRPRAGFFLAALLALPAPLFAQDRFNRTSPGLILETGARHATCDALTFTPDGSSLLATGDDKVVRVWPVGPERFVSRRSRTLRWPIFREQRGGIFTLALSPDASRLAVGGFGVKTGYLAVLNRETGAIEHALENPPTAQVTWYAAFSPSGRYLAYGTETGELYRWDLKANAKTSVRLGPAGRRTNRVRLVAFLDRTCFVSVAQDGVIREWDVTRPKAKPRKVGRCTLPSIYRAALGKGGRWLAACGEGDSAENSTRRVELIDLEKLRAGEGPSRRFLPFPQTGGDNCFPRALAFDAAGRRLAVGGQSAPQPPPGGATFARITGGEVHVFSVADGKRLTKRGLNLGYRAEAVAFRPKHDDQIATAGGENHEVRLWDLNDEGKPLDEIRSPGACLWGVAMSKDNRYLAWKEKRSSSPRTPNRWGAGPWRVLDLKTRRIVPKTPADFEPVKPLDSVGGWRVETTSDGFVWRVVGPGGTDVALDTESGLYLTAVNQIPRCYTFLEAGGGKPVRLAVGHSWGVSLYELRPGEVKLARLMVGHEGEVMAVAPAAKGKLLVTASRDQTLAGWSLEDWPAQRELGARFQETRDGTIEVTRVNLGSPAWEAGLTEGDEIVMVVSSDRDAPRGFVYDPHRLGLEKYKLRMEIRERCNAAQVLRKLRDAQPNREYIFVWRHDGKEQIQLTTVRQRPLWRFFPLHSRSGNDWVMWRWRDFYYDTSSAVADGLVGWHVNAQRLDREPVFYPLEYFRGTDQIVPAKGERVGFHHPDKVWPFIARAFQAPDKVIFPDIEPPEVHLEVVKAPGKNADLVLKVLVKPHGAGAKQELRRVTLWLDDYRYDKPLRVNKAGEVNEPKLVVPRGSLRHGLNRITLLGYNAQGGRGQATVAVDFDDGKPVVRDLHALCVGINDYRRARKRFGSWLKNLSCSRNDAEEMKRVLDQQKGSRLYRESYVELLEEEEATARGIAARLRKLGGKVGRDDWFVLFLSGHGHARGKGSVYEPGTFYYLCSDSDVARPETMLTSRELYNLLASIPCRKLIVLDTCRSGDVASNPIRDLTRDGVPLLIFSSCDATQQAFEPTPEYGKHGLFTQCLLRALADSSAGKGKKRLRAVTARDLALSIRDELPKLLHALAPEETQTPVFYPPLPPPLLVLCKP